MSTTTFAVWVVSFFDRGLMLASALAGSESAVLGPERYLSIAGSFVSITSIPRACVMGHPVAHSRSPMIHGYWLALLGIPGAYDLQHVAPGAFENLLPHLP